MQKKDKKRIIWSNIDLNVEDWKEGYKQWLELNEIDDRDPEDEDDVYEWAVETNDEYLDDERENLNKLVDGRILVIGDIGRWNGRVDGYKILSNNINEIFNINSRGFAFAEFYGDGHNVRATEHHHDGANYYLYRIIREDRNVDKLLDAIYNGEEITSSKLNYYTKSLYKDVAKIYGW
jgi:hypothetical protein